MVTDRWLGPCAKIGRSLIWARYGQTLHATAKLKRAVLPVVKVAIRCLMVFKLKMFEPAAIRRRQVGDADAHPGGFAYADDLFSLNFLKEYKGSDRLRTRTFVNQIGQIHISVAQELGYTILPESGVDAFSGTQDVVIAKLPKRRFNDFMCRAATVLKKRFAGAAGPDNKDCCARFEGTTAPKYSILQVSRTHPKASMAVRI
ncbi:hypothetical protein [Sulfitobacter geojensis]|uniref:Uncharacterized protein n=1 Tax=Sulfitobacter geojensis TaxID=1342299 RepID=A0AAE2VZE0_9RHOB|nr:hypothetical protein [Sulfitobacter geojensis]MBM1694093.1 hypothetical protein [Sulfitobacter geojensis]MBM1706259.1 hypothetical protein [Sulfitobacter geojensis]MBM1710317.1 hypothetical protein [Sulfitobacter geojensis]MBM1714383.1 hypothetical protein [Sulfitobacter geojensis]